MNFKHLLATLLTAVTFTAQAADRIIQAPSANGNIVFKNSAGTTVLQVNPAGTVTGVGGGTPPGMVPVGGMVAVMPSTHANAWQPPASGAIKDGFMRADGATISAQNVTDGSVFPQGTVLPNMVGSFPKGATTTGTATAAQKLVASNIPQVSTTYTPAGTNAASSISGTAAGQTLSSVNSGTENSYTSTYGVGYVRNTVFSTQQLNAATGVTVITTADGYSHKHDIGHTHAASAVTGTAAAQGFTGTAATITVGTAVGSQTVAPDPANVTVFWVIRVK